MRASKLLTASALALFLVGLTHLTFAQQTGCEIAPCSPNPVPCAHVNRRWTDGWSYTWDLTSPSNPSAPGTQTVTGTLVVKNPVDPSCPDFTWNIQTGDGTLTQMAGKPGVTSATTRYHWKASNPTPTECGGYTAYDWFEEDGTLSNNSCDAGAGTSTNSPAKNGTA